MDNYRDYSSIATDPPSLSLGYSIVHSPPFTFLVGANHTKLTVQSGLARHVSQPLDHLMNSGETRESKHHIAVLEEEDVETFVAFCEYAYTGDYSVPGPDNREEYQEQVVNNPFKGVFSGEPVLAQPDPKPSDETDKGQSKPSEEVQPQPEQAPPTPEPEYPLHENKAPEEPLAAPVEPPQEPEPVPEPAPEEPVEQPPATPAVEEGEPADANEGAGSGKGKKGKKNKKDKKKKGAVAAEEPTTNLTPPSTPPPQKLEQVENPPVDETPAPAEEWNQPQESIEPPADAEAAQPAEPVQAEVDTWERSAPTPQEPETVEPERTSVKAETKEEEKVTEEPKPSHFRTNSFIDMSFARQRFNFQHESGSNLWDEFAAMDYHDPRQTHGNRPPSSLSYSASTKGDLPYLVFHAKLYVFATRFLIPALAQLCLRKLHTDLLNLGFPEHPMDSQDEETFALTTTKARMILDLLDYTYNKTTRLEPISAISATQLRDNELRRLVVHYAACKIRDLAEFCPPEENTAGMPYPHKRSAKGLRPLLDTTTELASDLVYRMMW
ncbi:hypothetical protein COH20_004128 [Aspergillus flavus]|nr:hypothetical protein COH20_004128 [Aspergillus flavus]RAQ79556.1 hypothetical protein COH21_007873 [Aspergillus flavus]